MIDRPVLAFDTVPSKLTGWPTAGDVGEKLKSALNPRPLAETEIVDSGGVRLYVVHDVAQVDFEPAAAGFAAVIAGHSHKPRCEERGGVLWFNPGSAGPRRFRLPVAVGRLAVALGRVSGEIVELRIP